VVSVLEVDVSTSVTVTATPGSLDPEGSVTKPAILPVVTWAKTNGWTANNSAIPHRTKTARKHSRVVMSYFLSTRKGCKIDSKQKQLQNI
jgi:hypothetical protein